MNKKYDSVYSILLDILQQLIAGGGGGGSTLVIDNLESDNAFAALSANQGRVLKGLIDQLTTNVDTADARITSLEDELMGVVATADEINGEII